MPERPAKSVLVFLDIGVCAHKNGVPQGRLLKCDVDGANLKVICEGLCALPDGIAVDDEDGYIYFTQMGMPGTKTGSLSRVRLDGTGREDIIGTGETWTPKQLLLEPHSKKLYWTDREGAKIWRANRDGSDAQVLIQTVPGPLEISVSDQTKWPVGVAVDFGERRIFWTQKGPSKGSQGQLWVANLDIPGGETAENRSDKRILMSKLPEPIDLSFDSHQNVLFLSDRGEVPLGNTISAIHVGDLDSVKQELVVWKLHEAIGIVCDSEKQKIYMTDLLGGLYSANTDGSDKQILHSDLGELTGITIARDWN